MTEAKIWSTLFGKVFKVLVDKQFIQKTKVKMSTQDDGCWCTPCCGWSYRCATLPTNQQTKIDSERTFAVVAVRCSRQLVMWWETSEQARNVNDRIRPPLEMMAAQTSQIMTTRKTKTLKSADVRAEAVRNSLKVKNNRWKDDEVVFLFSFNCTNIKHMIY